MFLQKLLPLFPGGDGCARTELTGISMACQEGGATVVKKPRPAGKYFRYMAYDAPPRPETTISVFLDAQASWMHCVLSLKTTRPEQTEHHPCCAVRCTPLPQGRVYSITSRVSTNEGLECVCGLSPIYSALELHHFSAYVGAPPGVGHTGGRSAQELYFS